MRQIEPHAARADVTRLWITVSAVSCVLLYCSYAGLSAIQWILHWLADITLLELAVAWVALLPLFIIRVPNVLALKAVGYHDPSPDELAYLSSLWQEVAIKAGVSSSGYTFVVSDSGTRNDIVIGRRVVALGGGSKRLSSEEMSAMLARQIGARLTLGFVLWAVMPAILWIGLYMVGVKIARLLRRVGRGFSSAADAINPKTEFEAGVGIMLYLIALTLWLVPTIIVIGAAPLALMTLLAPLLASYLFRLTDYMADKRSVSYGYGRSLINALRKLYPGDKSTAGWRRMLSLQPPPENRIVRIHNILASDG